MKHTNIFFAGIALLFAACSNEPEINDQVENNTFARVRVHVNGFNVTQENFSGTRAAEFLSEYDGVNAITLAFYKSDCTEAYKTTQARTDAGFGEFNLSLPMGSYTMVALAYYTNENSVLTLTSPTEATFSTRARETFAATQAVTIGNTSAVDISATLNRIVSMLTVTSTDGKVSDVSNVRMTLSAGGKDFNPTTGFALTNTGLVNTVGSSAAVGNTSTSSTVFFLATDEQNIDVTIETLNADGDVLFSKTVTNVPFKRNRVTKLTGKMYTNDAVGGTFQVETAWLTEENVSF